MGNRLKLKRLTSQFMCRILDSSKILLVVFPMCVVADMKLRIKVTLHNMQLFTIILTETP